MTQCTGILIIYGLLEWFIGQSCERVNSSLFMEGNIASEASRIPSFLQASGFNYKNVR